MNSFILFQQLLVLCALMLTGYIAYKKNFIDDNAYTKLSSLMTCMMAEEYGGDGSECAKIITITTLCTIVTASLVILIAA